MAQLQVSLTSYSLMKANIIFSFPITLAGTDYTDTTVTLTFDATIATQMVAVSILDDNVVEDTEFINLTLTSVDSAVTLNPPTARIDIEDIDSELRLCHNYITLAFICIKQVRFA